MSTRHFVALVVVCVGMLLGGVSATAQSDQTAQALYEQGIAQFKAEEYQAARATLRKVDPRQLANLKDREAYFETLIAIDQKLGPAEGETPKAPAAAAEPAKPATPAEPVADTQAPQAPAAPTPEQLLEQGHKAAEAGDLAQAADLYQMVINSAEATKPTKQAARAAMAQLGRARSPRFTAAKAAYDEAASLYEAGEYATAKAALEAIDPADLDNQWFYVEGRRKMISGVDALLAKAAAPATPTATVAQADTPTTPAPARTAPAAPQSDMFAQARQLYAQQEVAAGEEAQAAGNYRVAIRHFERALELDPANASIETKLNAAVAANNAALAQRTPLDTVTSNTALLREAARVEYQEAMNSARARLQERDFAAAIDFVEKAKTVVDRNQRLLTAATYRDLRSQADTLSAQIIEQRRAEEARARAEAEVRSSRVAEQEEEAARERQQREVQSLLQQARQLQHDLEFDRALELIDQALFIDPLNIAGQAMKDMVEDSKILFDYRHAKRQLSLEEARLAVSNAEATIPYDDLLVYPLDWPQITATRLSALEEDGGDTEANRRAGQLLREPVPINFEGNRFVNVIDYLRNTTGANFFVNWPALESVGVEQDAPVSLQLTNVPAEQALRLVIQQVGQVAEFDPIGYSIIEGVVTIDTQRNLKRSTDTRVYDIRDLLVQVPNFDDAPGFDLNDALSNTNSGGSSGGGGGGGGGSGSSIFGDEEDQEGEGGPTRAELVDSIITLIQDSVGTPEEWVDLESSLRELNGNLIVKTTPDNHRAIVGLLAQLRETRAIQIHVEARFLLVDRHFLENFNLDLDVSWIGSGNFGPISVEQDSATIADQQTTALTPDNLVAGRSLDLSASFLDDLEVNLVVQATQASQRSLSLTAPRVTFFNGQRAYVLVARQISFISDLEPVPDSAGFDVTLSVTQSGVVLDVEGTISNDRRYVTLTLRPSLATIQEPIRSIPVGGGVIIDDDTGDSITLGDAFIEAPDLELTQVRCTVSIPDRGTLLVGGQRLVGEVDVEAGVPVLSKIPVLNRLFTNTSSIKDERTLLILVKPTIIIQSEQEDELFPGLLQDPQKFSVGGSY